MQIPSGHCTGHRDTAMSYISSMRMLTESVDIFRSYPSNDLLSERSENEAYCIANEQGEYLLYFPASGSVGLNIQRGLYQLRWLNVRTSSWKEPVTFELPGSIETPDNDIWALSVMVIK